jgi:predicted permease
LIQQLLTESIILASLGGALGLLLTFLTLGAIKQLIPIPLPNFVSADVDVKVFAFTFLISIVTGLIFGLIPAFQASRPNFNELLKEGTRGSTDGRQKNVRNGLVIAEIALTLVLLIEAGLMIKSLERLQSISPGFNMDNLLLMNFNLSEKQYAAAALATVPGQLADRIASMPSVTSCSLTSDAPLQEDYSATSVSIEGRPLMPGENEIRVFRHRIAPGYFSTMQIPLLSGRDFGSQDSGDAQRVVVLSNKMARKYWPNEDPLGKRIKMGGLDDKGPWLTIVGIVGDVKYRNLVESEAADPDAYFPLTQSPYRTLTLVARTSGDPARMASSMRRELLNFDSGLAVYDIATMKQRLIKQTAQSRFNAMLLAVFAFVALSLAALGVYGVTSFSVKQRTQEMGIRLALGATASDINRLIMGQGARLAAIGLSIGLTATFALSGVIKSLLYGISTTDPITFLSATGVLVGIVLAACYFPARRATRVDPVIALRNE